MGVLALQSYLFGKLPEAPGDGRPSEYRFLALSTGVELARCARTHSAVDPLVQALVGHGTRQWTRLVVPDASGADSARDPGTWLYLRIQPSLPPDRNGRPVRRYRLVFLGAPELAALRLPWRLDPFLPDELPRWILEDMRRLPLDAVPEAEALEVDPAQLDALPELGRQESAWVERGARYCEHGWSVFCRAAPPDIAAAAVIAATWERRVARGDRAGLVLALDRTDAACHNALRAARVQFATVAPLLRMPKGWADLAHVPDEVLSLPSE